jgi:hypothetical protein
LGGGELAGRAGVIGRGMEKPTHSQPADADGRDLHNINTTLTIKKQTIKPKNGINLMLKCCK